MAINFSNTNTLWASVCVETLVRLGLTTAVISPGSRSAPLTVALAQHPSIEAIPVLDERSAAFFALGLARRSHHPTLLVCSSGTAGANFYPAVIEARESRVPLLILTADRPPELRECNAGQTIDQQKLYGTFPNWYSELAVPSLDLALLAYLRQTLVYACEKTLYPVAGPVHLNCPFRDPLAPVLQAGMQTVEDGFPTNFFDGVVKIGGRGEPGEPRVWGFWEEGWHGVEGESVGAQWQGVERGVIVAGVAQPRSPHPYCEAIAHLSKTLRFPVLAEGLSPVRNYSALNPYLISTYDLMLRHKELADKLAPELVIRIGEMPTSKELRSWLERIQPRQYVVDEGDRNLDPLHLQTTHLRLSVERLASLLSPASPLAPSSYLSDWLSTEAPFRQALDQRLEQTDGLFEGKVAWILSQCLPTQTPLFIANSMAVRDVEWFWKPGDRHIQPFFNRGANGIDGTLSTALGVAHRGQSTVLLTGDLALLHDTNGLLLRNHLVGHLTIVVINNEGGGIFEMLPIAQFDPPFEEFFATPQRVNLSSLCAAYGVAYELVESWEQLIQGLKDLTQPGIRVLEVRSDRKLSAQWRKLYLKDGIAS